MIYSIGVRKFALFAIGKLVAPCIIGAMIIQCAAAQFNPSGHLQIIEPARDTPVKRNAPLRVVVSDELHRSAELVTLHGPFASQSKKGLGPWTFDVVLSDSAPIGEALFQVQATFQTTVVGVDIDADTERLIVQNSGDARVLAAQSNYFELRFPGDISYIDIDLVRPDGSRYSDIESPTLKFLPVDPSIVKFLPDDRLLLALKAGQTRVNLEDGDAKGSIDVVVRSVQNGDFQPNGVIDGVDLDILMENNYNLPSLGWPYDARDLNHDGRVDLNDARELRKLCTYPQCASTAEDTVGINDADDDFVNDRIDNCQNATNPDQSDSDGDKVGDACDLCPADPLKTMPLSCGCGHSESSCGASATPVPTAVASPTLSLPPLSSPTPTPPVAMPTPTVTKSILRAKAANLSSMLSKLRFPVTKKDQRVATEQKKRIKTAMAELRKVSDLGKAEVSTLNNYAKALRACEVAVAKTLKMNRRTFAADRKLALKAVAALRSIVR